MPWTTLTLRVTTPLFNGGADPANEAALRPADEAGVRVASIRGAMRFWFRALAGALTGPDLGLLAGMERLVFGGAGSEAGGPGSSPLLLRIPRQPAIVPPSGPHEFLPAAAEPLNDRRKDDSRWILYLMGQGLADLAQMSISRPYVAPGQEFDLKVGFRHARTAPVAEREAVEAIALCCLWLACAYGGIGARTRRGLGGVRITGAQGTDSLPPPWVAEGALLTPSLGHYGKLDKIWPADGPVAACMRYFAVLAGGRRLNPRAWEGVPSFPVLSRTHAPAGLSGGDPFVSWQDALMTGGEQLRHFRASQPHQGERARYQPFIETPEWIATVHGKETRYPVGALGLPVVMQDGYLANADGPGPADPAGRRASPLWIRAVGSGREWRLFSFAFQSRFLPAGAHLWQRGARRKPLQITDADVKQQTDQWIRVLREDKTFKPYRHADGTVGPDEQRRSGDLHR